MLKPRTQGGTVPRCPPPPNPPPMVARRTLQWSGNPYGNGYGVEMDGNGAQFVKMLWIGLDLGEGHHLKFRGDMFTIVLSQDRGILLLRRIARCHFWTR